MNKKASCNTLKQVNAFINYLNQHIETQFSNTTLFALKIIYEELILNAWYHGHDSATDVPLKLNASITSKPSFIEVILQDNAKPFDSKKINTNKSLTEKNAGGHGISLIEHFCYDWQYSYVDGMNINHLKLCYE